MRSRAGSANSWRIQRIARAADDAVVEVGLGRVDREHADAVLAQHLLPRPELLLEVDVADVARVVVARHDDDVRALDPVEVGAGLDVLLAEPERRQVAGHDHDVGLEVVHLDDRPVHQVRDEVRRAAVEVGDVRDRERPGHGDRSYSGRSSASRSQRRSAARRALGSSRSGEVLVGDLAGAAVELEVAQRLERLVALLAQREPRVRGRRRHRRHEVVGARPCAGAATDHDDRRRRRALRAGRSPRRASGLAG